MYDLLLKNSLGRGLFLEPVTQRPLEGVICQVRTTLLATTSLIRAGHTEVALSVEVSTVDQRKSETYCLKTENN